MRNDVFPFSHSVVTAEGAAAAAEMACQCPNPAPGDAGSGLRCPRQQPVVGGPVGRGDW